MICVTLADATAFAIGALGKGRRRANSFASAVDDGGYTDPPATYSVHGDMRTIAVEAKKSIHAAAGSVISISPGRLYGFLVVGPGTGTTTVTVHDNASAASGTVLRSASASEIVRGAWIYCGANGLAAANGLYVSLGGTTRPILLAIFEGDYPTVSHSGTVRYLDGTDGNDAWDGTTESFVSGTTGPRKTWGSDYMTGNWNIKCKRGTIIDVSNSPGDMPHSGTDWLIEDYGDPDAAKPVLRQSASKTGSFTFTASSGVVEFRNIKALSLLSSRKNGGGISAPAGARAIFTNCEAENFTTGLLYGGQYSVIDGCSTIHCTSGSDGSTAYAAPDYALVMNCDLYADSDVYGLHDGSGTGVGNVCFASSLTVDPDFVSGTGGVIPENCVDINAQYDDTLVGFNDVFGSNDPTATYPISSDALAQGVSAIANNVRCGTASGIRLRSPNWTVTGNAIVNVGTVTKNSACLHIDVTATNGKIFGNYCFMNAAAQRPMVVWVAGASSGQMKNNVLESVNATQRILDMGAGAVAGWGAGTFATNDYWAPGITNTTTFANISGGGGAQRLSTFSAAYAGGSELNVDPDLDADYRPPDASALIGAGTNLGVVYMGFDGPFWQAGPPTVGATELQR